MPFVFNAAVLRLEAFRRRRSDRERDRFDRTESAGRKFGAPFRVRYVGARRQPP